MPMYSFVCSRCGHAFEELLPISRREEGKCPLCGAAAGRNLKREGFSRVSASGECGCEGCEGGGCASAGGCSGHCAGCSGCGKGQ